MSTLSVAGANPAIDDTTAGTQSAVTWPAVFAGAAVTTTVTILLLALGAGIGFSSVSPWQNSGASAGTIAVGALIWLIIVQWVSSAFGGYIAGRLRTRWTGLHTDEVFFRDTAHGFIAWSIATIFTVAVVAAGVSSLVGTAGRAAGALAEGASRTAVAATPGDPSALLVDTLFRPQQPRPDGNATEAKTEAGRILASSIANGSLAAADRTYLAQLAAAQAGIPPAEAEKRVDEMVAQAKAAADKAKVAADTARRTTATLSFFTAFSMLIGAFIASVAGALGGRLRDA